MSDSSKINLRKDKSIPLTHDELDGNFEQLGMIIDEHRDYVTKNDAAVKAVDDKVTQGQSSIDAVLQQNSDTNSRLDDFSREIDTTHESSQSRDDNLQLQISQNKQAFEDDIQALTDVVGTNRVDQEKINDQLRADIQDATGNTGTSYSQLVERIENEETNRANADDGLQTQISTNKTNSEQAISTLDGKVDRQGSELGSDISDLSNQVNSRINQLSTDTNTIRDDSEQRDAVIKNDLDSFKTEINASVGKVETDSKSRDDVLTSGVKSNKDRLDSLSTDFVATQVFSITDAKAPVKTSPVKMNGTTNTNGPANEPGMMYGWAIIENGNTGMIRLFTTANTYTAKVTNGYFGSWTSNSGGGGGGDNENPDAVDIANRIVIDGNFPIYVNAATSDNRPNGINDRTLYGFMNVKSDNGIAFLSDQDDVYYSVIAAGTWGTWLKVKVDEGLLPVVVYDDPRNAVYAMGNVLSNKKGETVALNGVTIDSWLTFEKDVSGIRASTSHPTTYNTFDIINVLTDRFGERAARRLVDTWRANWVTEQDIIDIVSYGFDHVRIPITSDVYYQWPWMDWVVSMSEKYGFGVIFTMKHWEGDIVNETESLQYVMDAWAQIAQRYQYNNSVLAYEILYGFSDLATEHQVYSRIRQIDNDKPIIVYSDTTSDANIWEDVVYSKVVKTSADIPSAKTVPIYLSETYRSILASSADSFEENDWSWTMWAFKGIDANNTVKTYSSDNTVNVDTDSSDAIRTQWSAIESTLTNTNPPDFI